MLIRIKYLNYNKYCNLLMHGKYLNNIVIVITHALFLILNTPIFIL